MKDEHDLTPLGYVRRVNKEYRDKDESHLYPINGKFNVTERAIRRLRKHFGGYGDLGDYRAALDQEISDIVNRSI